MSHLPSQNQMLFLLCLFIALEGVTNILTDVNPGVYYLYKSCQGTKQYAYLKMEGSLWMYLKDRIVRDHLSVKLEMKTEHSTVSSGISVIQGLCFFIMDLSPVWVSGYRPWEHHVTHPLQQPPLCFNWCNSVWKSWIGVEKEAPLTQAFLYKVT